MILLLRVIGNFSESYNLNFQKLKEVDNWKSMISLLDTPKST